MIPYIFPTINNVEPNKSRYSTVYSELVYTDTTYTVKHRPPKVDMYVAATINDVFTSIAKWTGVTPLVKFHYGKGYPPEISPNYNDGNLFGLHYQGKFDQNSGTTATFYLTGHGKARIKVNSTNLATVDLTSDNIVASLNVTGLGVSNTVEIWYVSPNKFSQKSNTLCVTWKNASVLQPIPMSTGNFYNTLDDAIGINSYALPYTSNINIDINKKQVGKLEFTLPLVQSTASVGYTYEKDGDYLQHTTNATIKIRKFRMVEFNAGYDYSGTPSTLTKFAGQVRGWTIDRSTRGDQVKVEVYDWGVFLRDAFNEGYPNVSDYLAFDYRRPENESGVAGDTKPRTYDGWHFKDAVDSLLINAYIDPKTLEARRKQLNVENVIDTGRYLVNEKGLDNSVQIKLEKSLSYGAPLTTDENLADSEYIWQFSVGAAIGDNLQSLMDNYGFSYGFNNDGDFYQESVKGPAQTKSTDEMLVTGNWTEVIGASKFYAFSLATQTEGSKIVATYIGRTAKLMFDVGPNTGTIHIKLSNPTLGQVASLDYHTNHTTARSFLDGTDDTVGYNPCVLGLGDYNYGSYSLNLTTKGTSTVSINSLLIYDKNYDDEVDTYYTGDESPNLAVVTNAGIRSDAGNVRNDVVVVGRLRGVSSNLSVDPEQPEKVINPKNPVQEHVLGRAIDRQSIGSLSSNHFVGRRLQTMIIEPKVATERKALWLASETAKRFNTFEKAITPQLDMIGQPLLEVGDKIKVKDIKTSSMATMHDFYISGINDVYGANGRYTTSLTLESFEPWESFISYPIPSLTRLGNTVFLNPKVYNVGIPIKKEEKVESTEYSMNNYPDPGDDTIIGLYRWNDIEGNVPTQAELQRAMPYSGYIKFNNEVIKYGSVVFSTLNTYINPIKKAAWATITFTDLTRGMFNTSTIADFSVLVGNPDAKFIETQISPYVTEEFNVQPAVEFDLLFSGQVKVLVRNHMGVIVDILTGTPNTYTDTAGWDSFQPGKYSYTWGMIDAAGRHNQENCGSYGRQGGHSYDFPSYGDDPNSLARLTNNNHKNYRWKPDISSVRAKWIDSDHQSVNIAPYRPGQGYYVWNKSEEKYGQFYFEVQYRDPTKQLVTEVLSIPNLRKIHTVMRPQGYNISWGSDGIFEEFRHTDTDGGGARASGIDYTSLSESWRRAPGIDLKIRDMHPDYHYYYSGTENDNKGLRYVVKSKFNVDRIVNLTVERKILVFLYHYAMWTQEDWMNPGGDDYENPTYSTYRTGKVDLVQVYEDPLEIQQSHTWTINQDRDIEVYLGAPELPYITPEAENKIKAIYDLVGMTHVHALKLTITDFSGRKHVLGRSVFYRAPSFLATDNNQTRGYHDGTVNWALQLREFSTGPYTYRDIPELGREAIYYPIFYRGAQDYNRVAYNKLIGVQLYKE